jgi:hypothetical protein
VPEGLEAANLVEDATSHEAGHPCGAVDAEQIGREVDAGVTCAKIHLKRKGNEEDTQYNNDLNQAEFYA